MTGGDTIRPFWRARSGFDTLVAALDGPRANRLVGGAVRDALLGTSPSDIDLATVHPPDTVLARLHAAGVKALPTGIAHGTVTAVLPDGPVEVTTLRRDVQNFGRHAQVVFTDDWFSDAQRRDFTINALFADVETGAITDFFGGRADLDAGKVRFIGDPSARIAEDHLRILRFFRFFARYGRAPVDADGYSACQTHARSLMALSRERIAAEILKTLASPQPVTALRLMVDGGILAPVLPEITTQGVNRLEQLVRRETEVAVVPNPLRRMAALLPPDARNAADVGRRLKLAKAQTQRLVQLAPWPEKSDPMIVAYRLGPDVARDRILLSSEPLAVLIPLKDYVRPRLPISGGDLIQLGVPKGPLVARTLAAIEADWLAQGCPSGSQFEAIVSAHHRPAHHRPAHHHPAHHHPDRQPPP